MGIMGKGGVRLRDTHYYNMYGSSYGETMSNQFDLLAKAKPAALYRLLAKLSLEDAAIVLTRLPDTLAFQVIAYFPEDRQIDLGPAMVEARWEEETRVEETAARIRTLLAEGKKNMAAKGETGVRAVAGSGGSSATGSPSQTQSPGQSASMSPQPEKRVQPTNSGKNTAVPADRANAAGEAAPKERAALNADAKPLASGPLAARRPSPRSSTTPVARPSGNAAHGRGSNPYQNAAADPSSQPLTPASGPAAGAAPAKPGLAARAKEMAREVMKSTFSSGSSGGGDRKAANRPQPWVPRTATASPINGPALPGKPPPVAGDPFTSPLAKAGLLDLIGRAQQTLLPKGTFKEPARSDPPSKPLAAAKPSAGGPRPGKGGRPEPREGVVSRQAVVMSRTPRTIGPRPAAVDAGELERVPTSGGRRMDGKAILAAILREAGEDVRGTVRHDDPGLFNQLRERMFYFDDLIYTEDNALARVFTAAPTEDAALALKFAAPALRDRVVRVVSPGRARALRENAAKRAGLDDIESAQKKVLDIALQLQAAGRILIDPRDPDLAK